MRLTDPDRVLPERLVNDEFVLRPVSVDDAEADHAAVMDADAVAPVEPIRLAGGRPPGRGEPRGPARHAAPVAIDRDQTPRGEHDRTSATQPGGEVPCGAEEHDVASPSEPRSVSGAMSFIRPPRSCGQAQPGGRTGCRVEVAPVPVHRETVAPEGGRTAGLVGRARRFVRADQDTVVAGPVRCQAPSVLDDQFGVHGLPHRVVDLLDRIGQRTLGHAVLLGGRRHG